VAQELAAVAMAMAAVAMAMAAAAVHELARVAMVMAMVTQRAAMRWREAELGLWTGVLMVAVQTGWRAAALVEGCGFAGRSRHR